MKVLENRLRGDVSITVVYIDCRTLGSTEQFSDSSVPLAQRCLSLFRDFLLAIHRGLLEHICEQPSPRTEEALRELENLAGVITEPLSILKAEKLTVSEQTSRSAQAGAKIIAKTVGTTPKVTLKTSAGIGSAASEEKHTQFDVETKQKIIFPHLLGVLQTVLDLAETRLFVLVDEWSSLPLDIQPYLAEFLKRGFLPINTATLKISALEYRCRFNEETGNFLMGFELGADIAT